MSLSEKYPIKKFTPIRGLGGRPAPPEAVMALISMEVVAYSLVVKDLYRFDDELTLLAQLAGELRAADGKRLEQVAPLCKQTC